MSTLLQPRRLTTVASLLRLLVKAFAGGPVRPASGTMLVVRIWSDV